MKRSQPLPNPLNFPSQLSTRTLIRCLILMSLSFPLQVHQSPRSLQHKSEQINACTRTLTNQVSVTTWTYRPKSYASSNMMTTVSVDREKLQRGLQRRSRGELLSRRPPVPPIQPSPPGVNNSAHDKSRLHGG